MNRLIEVYTINRQSFMCQDAREYYTYKREQYYLTDKRDNPYIVQIDTQQWKIKRICETVKIDNNPFNRQHFERYLAVEPELEAILVAEVKKDYEDLVDDLRNQLNYRNKAFGVVINNVLDLDLMPWWKRVWISLKGDLTQRLF